MRRLRRYYGAQPPQRDASPRAKVTLTDAELTIAGCTIKDNVTSGGSVIESFGILTIEFQP